jgi:hypothetical protein
MPVFSSIFLIGNKPKIGGSKYLVHNIIFKFSIDTYLFQNNHNSQKLASHELKSLINVFHHGSKLGIYVPMMMVLDFKGNIKIF